MSLDGLAAQLILPPVLKDGQGSYEGYKRELEVWQLMIGEPTKEGPLVFRSLQTNFKAKSAISELTVTQIGSKDGVKLILEKLDKAYLGDENIRIITCLEKFETFKRLPSVNMTSFILEFERLHSQLKSHGITYPDGVLAYRIMKAASISSEHEQLLRATIKTGKWSYEAVLQQLKKIFNEISSVQSSQQSERTIKVEETMFTENPYSSSQGYISNNYEDYDELHYHNFTDGVEYEPNFPQSVPKIEEHDVYYGSRTSSRGTQPWKWNSGRPGGRSYFPSPYRPSERPSFQNTKGFQRFGEQFNSNQQQSRQDSYGMNPKDHRGYPTVCRKCRSTYHYWDQCPHVSPQERINASKKVMYNQSSPHSEDQYIALIALSQKPTPTSIHETFCLMSETLNKAVIDSGCTKTVAGERWFDAYLETLSDDERNDIQTMDSKAQFRFGDSPPVTAIKKVLLPMKLSNVNLLLETEIVSSDVPLLLSKDTMKRAKAKINFVDDKIELFGEEQSMMCTSSGHYAIPMNNNYNIGDDVKLEAEVILFANQGNTDKKVVAKKLHTQFGHPKAKRLNELIDNSAMEDTTELKQEIEDLSEKCDICKRYRKSRPKPVVTFPLASVFNETVAMDLKIYKNNAIYFLHLIDHATRFSQAVVIRSKKAETIAKNFMMSWVAVFGCPEKVLSDNGGEFANSTFVDLCENLNINFMTTAAESPWSNGLVEKHNDIIGEAVSKIVEDTKCSVEVALCWAINAKNSLQNIHGFSPYQLVFGHNPNLPSVLTNKLPALEGVSESHLVADLLNALHSARREMIMLESSEKIRRALRAQTRTHTNIKYLAGEEVFYKRQDERRWRGPGRVIGQDGSKVLIKIPTGLISVHSCNVILTSDAEAKRLEGGEIDAEAKRLEGGEVEGEKHKEEYDASNDQASAQNEEKYNYVEPVVIPQTESMEEEASDRSEDISTEHDDQNAAEENAAEENLGEENSGEEDSGEGDSGEENLVTEDGVTDNVAIEPEVNINLNPELPNSKQVVQFKDIDSDEWEKAVILNKWGSLPGKRKEKHIIKVKMLNDDSERLVDWKNNVKEWKPFVENALVMSLLSTEENILVTSDKQGCEEEKEKELENWNKLEVYDEVNDEGQDCVTVKWVFSEKEVEGKKIKKARLVARGYQELADTQRDSPCVNKESQRVALAVIASEGWELRSLDVKAAFLQGKELDRDIYLKPPKEAKCPGKLWKLKRCVYGLNDASRFWYFRVKDELTRLGCKVSKLDSSLFTYHTDQLEGILIVHVDDFMFAGTVNFYQSVIVKLKETFHISKENNSIFKYLGVDLQQTHNGIYISQKKYLDKLQEIEISSSRSKEKQAPITEDERDQLRSTHGKINWLATQTRPDLAYDVCNLTTSLKHGTVDLIHKTNKAVKKAKYNTVFLYYPKLDLKNTIVRCYADASYGNLPDGGSQGGVYVELVDGRQSAPIEWQSKRLYRTAKSTLAAETIAMVEGVDSAYLTSKLLSEILYSSDVKVPVEAITDCYSLLEAAHSTKSIDDRRLRIELAMLRESILKKEIELIWINTGNQLADCLTKSGSNPKMLVEHITGKRVV